MKNMRNKKIKKTKGNEGKRNVTTILGHTEIKELFWKIKLNRINETLIKSISFSYERWYI